MNWKKILGNAITGFLAGWVSSGIVISTAPYENILRALVTGAVMALISGLFEAQAEIRASEGQPPGPGTTLLQNVKGYFLPF